MNMNKPHNSEEIHDKNHTQLVSKITNNQLIELVKDRLCLILGVSFGFSIIVGLYTLIQPPKYRGNFQLSIERELEQKEELNKVDVKGLNAKNLNYTTEIEILKSRGVLEPIIAIIAAKYPEINYQTLVNSSLTIKQLKNTNILEVYYEDRNPEKIKYVLDSLASGYLSYSLQAKKRTIEAGLSHIQARLPIASIDVERARKKQLLFQEKHNLIAPKRQAENLTEKITKLEEKYFNIQVALNEKKSLYLILEKQLGQNIQTAIAASYLSESTRYQELLNGLQEIEIKLANQTPIWHENSPNLVRLQQKKAKLLDLLDRQARASLGTNIFSANLAFTAALSAHNSLRLKLNQQFILAANEIEILRRKKTALAEAIRNLKQKIKQMPALLSEYNSLEKRLNLATQSLENLLSTKEELELESAKKVSLWQPISQAKLPETPIFPNRGKILSLGFIGGLILGSIALLLVDRDSKE